ncbi:hypothetical protein F443_21616, partial [Phytophthora nicotianae P1569]
YSPVEFACIVDIVPRKVPKTDKSQRGRKIREGFDLDPGHPHFKHYEAVIRAKMLTPMFGGPRPHPAIVKATTSKIWINWPGIYCVYLFPGISTRNLNSNWINRA